MLGTLYVVRETLKAELDQMFGIDMSTAIAQAFCWAVAQHKLELELEAAANQRGTLH